MRKLWSLALFLASSSAIFSQDAPKRPNFLIILGDDMTWTDVSSLGHPDVKTPTLDQLARDGMRLSHVFTPAPMCAPTRMALYTGLYPVRNGGHPNHSQVHAGTASLPHRLGALGYRVALTGKRHFGPADCFPFETVGKNGQLAFLGLRSFIQGCGENPWCAVVASHEPHSPWDKGDRSAYPPEQLTIPPWLADTPQTRLSLSRYYAEVSFLDQQVGRCLDVLKRANAAENTLVLFLSEQGAGLPHAKWTLYDHGVRAAAFVRWPGKVKPGSTSSALISYVDVLPTLIHLAGGAPPKQLDGRSFHRVLTGDSLRHHDAVFAVHTSRGISNGPRAYGIRAVRTGRYKLIHNIHHATRFQNNLTERPGVFRSWVAAASVDPRAAHLAAAYVQRPEWELYDTVADPHELTNLASRHEHFEMMADLRSKLGRWMKRQGDLGHATEMDAFNRQAPGRARRGRKALGKD